MLFLSFPNSHKDLWRAKICHGGVRPQQKREPRFKTCPTPKKWWYMTVKAQHLTIFCVIFDDWYIKLLTYSDSFSFRISGCAGCATFFPTRNRCWWTAAPRLRRIRKLKLGQGTGRRFTQSWCFVGRKLVFPIFPALGQSFLKLVSSSTHANKHLDKQKSRNQTICWNSSRKQDSAQHSQDVRMMARKCLTDAASDGRLQKVAMEKASGSISLLYGGFMRFPWGVPR